MEDKTKDGKKTKVKRKAKGVRTHTRRLKQAARKVAMPENPKK